MSPRQEMLKMASGKQEVSKGSDHGGKAAFQKASSPPSVKAAAQGSGAKVKYR